MSSNKTSYKGMHLFAPTDPFKRAEVNENTQKMDDLAKTLDADMAATKAKADGADTTAKGAKAIAEGIDAKATSALTNANAAVSTANTAKSTADLAAADAATAVEAADTAKTTAETVRGEFDAVVAEAGSNNPEVVQARGTAVNLGARLSGVDQQLADTTAITSRASNAIVPLDIATYDGSNQVTHPKVLYFEAGWNGFKYWMSYTPFPYENNFLENPCIAVSNDGVTWTTPTGLVNPLDSISEALRGKEYFSDAHLVYDSVNNTMEVWYRKAIETPAQKEIIYRKKSTDGITWSAAETLFESDGIVNLLSPAILIENGVYSIWLINGNENVIKQYESVTGPAWTLKRNIPITASLSNYSKLWHLDVIKTDLGYEMLVQMRVSGGTYKDTILFYTKSADGVTYETAKPVINKGRVGNFDTTGIYRSSILKVNGYYTIYYSGISQKNEWKIGVSQTIAPNNIATLQGMTNTTAPREFSELKIGSNGYVKPNRTKYSAKNTGATIGTNDSDPIGRLQIKDGNGDQFGHLEVGTVVLKDTYYPVTEAEGTLKYDSTLKRVRAKLNGVYETLLTQAVGKLLKFTAVNIGVTIAVDDNGRPATINIRDGNNDKPGHLNVGTVNLNSDYLPSTSTGYAGNLRYDSTSKHLQVVTVNNAAPLNVKNIRYGTTAQRPIGDEIRYGMDFYDATLDKPIYYSPVKLAWVDANGNLV